MNIYTESKKKERESETPRSYGRIQEEVMLRGSKRKTLCLVTFSVVVIFLIGQVVKRQLAIEASQIIVPQALAEYDNEEAIKIRAFKTVHLDFKGAAPRLSYFRKILPLLASAGCDSLLIEYEDMFPYTGRLANLSAGNAYTRQQIKTLITWAHDLNMEIIPLIQTFGHLEFALKLEELQHLRELPSSPQEICPSKDESLELVQEMLNQVMLMHKGIKYLHLGADEVFHLALCPKCNEKGLTPFELYAEYVAKVAEFVRNNYPGVKPIIWDDMLRTSPHLIGETKLPQLVELMIWDYSSDVSQLITSHLIYWYKKFFNHIWIAGAFKGASYPTTLLPELEKRFSNQMSWIKFIRYNHLKPNLAGYVLTGWSRFDHFAVLCELLPSSLPSLFLNLHLISLAFNNKIIEEDILFKNWGNSLSCPDFLHFTESSLKTDYETILRCNFPGIDLYEIVVKIIDLQQNVYKLDDSLTKKQGWLTKYNIIHNYTNTAHVQLVRDKYLYKAKNDIITFRKYTKIIFDPYFDKFVIKEWIEQNIEPLYDIINSLNNTISKVVKRKVWQKRPIV